MRHLLLLFLLSLLACDTLEVLTEVEGVRQQGEYALPLIDSRVNLTELVGGVDERVSLSVEEDGLLRFNYRDTVPPVSSEEAFDQLRALTSFVPLAIEQEREAITFPLPNNARLNEVILRSGDLVYNLPNTYDRPVEVSFSIPNLLKDGTPFQVSGQLPAYDGNGDPPTLDNFDTPLDLADYRLDFTGNSLILEYQIRELGGGALVPGENNLAVLRDLDFSYIEGYLGRQLYPGVDDRLGIDFFENYLSGEVSFVEPRIRITVINEFGVPARALIEELSVVNQDGEVLPVTGDIMREGFDFAFPSEPGESAATTYLVTPENSNLLELLAAEPVQLNYKINALLNPEENEEMIGFLSDTSAYEGLIDVELPLYGRATDFRLQDTFDLDLGDDYDHIQAASFRITTDNGIPFDLRVGGSLVDSLGNILTDLTDGELLIVRAGTVDDRGVPIEVLSTTTDIEFTGERLQLLRQADRLLLNTTFATTDGGRPAVRVTEDQELRVRVGVKISID